MLTKAIKLSWTWACIATREDPPPEEVRRGDFDQVVRAFPKTFVKLSLRLPRPEPQVDNMAASFEAWVESVLDSIFQEGVNSTTLEVMNYVFYALFAVLTTLFLCTSANLHVLALLLLAIALYLSTNWYVCFISFSPFLSFTRHRVTYVRFVSELHREKMRRNGAAPSSDQKQD